MITDSELLVGRALGVEYTREDKSESYVTVPPAFLITLSDGTTFTLGFEYTQPERNVYHWNVLVNDRDCGEHASHIEMRGGVVRIFTWQGMKTWSRARRTFI